MTSAEKKAYQRRYEFIDGLCQCCGQPVEYGNNYTMAHIRGKRINISKQDRCSLFVIVHPALHSYETDKAGNLLSDPCVTHFVDSGWMPGPHDLGGFYDKMIEAKGFLFLPNGEMAYL